MCSCLVHPCKPFPLVRIAFIAVLTLLLSGWSTCNAIVNFSSCPGTVPQPLISSLSPDPMPGNTESVVLIVNGSGFVPQSQIIWNGSALQTTFTDSDHLRATITQQTFDSFGGSVGSSVQIAAIAHSGRLVGYSETMRLRNIASLTTLKLSSTLRAHSSMHSMKSGSPRPHQITAKDNATKIVKNETLNSGYSHI
jgi:hypothetical protein